MQRVTLHRQAETAETREALDKARRRRPAFGCRILGCVQLQRVVNGPPSTGGEDRLCSLDQTFDRVGLLGASTEHPKRWTGANRNGLALAAEQAGATHGLQYSLRHYVRVPPWLAFPDRERLDDLPLPAWRDGAVAEERGQHPFMA